MAEERFISNMKRLRTMLGLSQAELAERIVALGGNMYQQTIAKLESGQRALRMVEADVIAAALGSTVSDMLRHRSNAIRRASAPSLDEIRSELKQVEDSLEQATMRTEIATVELDAAHQNIVVKQVEADRARAEHGALLARYAELQERLAAAVHGVAEREPRD